MRRVLLTILLLVLSGLASCATTPVEVERARPFKPVTVASREATVDLSGRPELARLLALALERNPGIFAAKERATARAEGAKAEGWLPNPSVVIGWYETEVETRVGPQEWSIGVRQPVPFPTKLKTKSEIADAEARRARIVYERTVRDTLSEVAITAWEIAYLDEAIGITAGIGALLERYAAVAATGESRLSEMFRAETQRAQLDNDRVLLSELRFAEAERLRTLLDLPPGTPVGTPRPPMLPDITATWDELLEILTVSNQEMKEAGLAFETASLRAELAEQRRIPDLTLGVTRIITDELDEDLGMDPDGNGDDPLIFSLGLTLPIWIPADSAAIRSARASERAAGAGKAHAAQQARSRLAKGWYRLGKAYRLDRLYAEVLVPRAGFAARTAEDLMTAGKGNLAGALETVAVLHNFRLAAARARADHGQELARLETILGRPVPEEHLRDAMDRPPVPRVARSESPAAPEPGTRAEITIEDPTVGELATLAVTRSPAVAAARARLRAARTAYRQSSDLADLVDLYRSFTGGPAAARIAPSPNVAGISGEVADRTVAIAAEELRAAELMAIATAHRIHADAAWLAETRRILDADLRLVRDLVSVLGAKLESGTARQAGYLAFTASLSRLEVDRTNLETVEPVIRARLNRLLDRPADAPVKLDWTPAEPGPTVSDREARTKALADSPQLRKARLMAERGRLAVRLAETMTLPRLDVGSSRLERGETFPEPGRMIMPRADFGVREAQVTGMRETSSALAVAALDMERKTAADTQLAWAESDSALRRVKNLEEEVVPLAVRSFESAKGAYEGNRTGYLDLLEAARRQLAAKKDLAMAKKNLAHARAALRVVMGADGEER